MVARNAFSCGRLLSIAAVVLVMAACASLRVGADFDRTANLSAYRSYSWMQRAHHGTSNPLTVQRTRDAIQSEFGSKGFTHVEDSAAADFVVDFTIGAHDRVDVQSYPAPFGGPGYWGYPGWWGYPYWGNEVDVRQYREGTLSIDVFDAHTHKPVWHGWAKKELTQSDIERSEAPIQAAVAAILGKFPPK